MSRRHRYKTGRRGRARRRAPKRAPSKSILIVCEGEKTEPGYFRHMARALRLPAVNVEVDVKPGQGSAPISVVDTAIALRMKRQRLAKYSLLSVPYDEVWCVIDVDQHPTLDHAYDKARRSRITLVISNPCFEYWYVLHFEKTRRPYADHRDVPEHLHKYIPQYSKGGDFFEILGPRTETAIANAEALLREQHCGEDLRDCNPSTHVHRLVQLLQNESGKK